MITERLEEQACLYAAGALPVAEQQSFEAQLAQNAELREFVSSMREATTSIALSAPQLDPPPGLKKKVLDRITAQSGRVSSDERATAASAGHKKPGFSFVE